MDGETNGGQEATEGTENTPQQQGQEQKEMQQGQQKVIGGNAPDYKKQIAERDEKIASLEAQVAEAPKNAETAEQLRGEIAELKAQGESERVDFRLQLSGVRNVKGPDGKWTQVPTYNFNDPMPYGHGEKSVYVVNGFLRLTREEAFAIRYHMGFSGNEDNRQVGNAFQMYPLAFCLSVADMEATYFLEKEE